MSISTWRHADIPCPYPHEDMQTLYVYIHMDTWRQSMSILCEHGAKST